MQKSSRTLASLSIFTACVFCWKFCEKAWEVSVLNSGENHCMKINQSQLKLQYLSWSWFAATSRSCVKKSSGQTRLWIYSVFFKWILFLKAVCQTSMGSCFLCSSLSQSNCWLRNFINEMSSSRSEYLERICERRKGSFYTVTFLTINIL